MLEDVRLLRIADRYDPRLLEFRRQVCRENGADDDFLNLDLKFKDVEAYATARPGAEVQELWKFGARNWRGLAFENLECVLLDDRIIQVSGCRRYNAGSMLRINMNLYLLREFRGRFRSLNFAEEGLIARHIDYARRLPGCRCVFFTIFPHNRRLGGLVRNLSSRRSRRGLAGPTFKYRYVDEFEHVDEPILFNQVPQHFFLYRLDPEFDFSREVTPCAPA